MVRPKTPVLPRTPPPGKEYAPGHGAMIELYWHYLEQGASEEQARAALSRLLDNAKPTTLQQALTGKKPMSEKRTEDLLQYICSPQKPCPGHNFPKAQAPPPTNAPDAAEGEIVEQKDSRSLAGRAPRGDGDGQGNSKKEVPMKQPEEMIENPVRPIENFKLPPTISFAKQYSRSALFRWSLGVSMVVSTIIALVILFVTSGESIGFTEPIVAMTVFVLFTGIVQAFAGWYFFHNAPFILIANINPKRRRHKTRRVFCNQEDLDELPPEAVIVLGRQEIPFLAYHTEREKYYPFVLYAQQASGTPGVFVEGDKNMLNLYRQVQFSILDPEVAYRTIRPAPRKMAAQLAEAGTNKDEEHRGRKWRYAIGFGLLVVSLIGIIGGEALTGTQQAATTETTREAYYDAEGPV